MATKIHRAVDDGVKPERPTLPADPISSRGPSPVTVTLKGNTAFNHVCGCTKCWKPEEALSPWSPSSDATSWRLLPTA